MLDDVIKEFDGVEVAPMDVYRDVFRLGEGQIQKEGEPAGKFKANPIGYFKYADKKKGHYRVMFEDTFEEHLKELQEADFSLLNGITYFGRKNVQEHASKMYAMILDLDGVDEKSLKNFLYASVSDSEHYPIPNYIVLSGHGVHLYYLFDDPISLFPNIKMQLKSLKYALIDKIWNKYTSTEKKKQFQGINQGFRAIGGRNTKEDLHNFRSIAYRIHEHPYSLRQLCDFVPEEYRVDESKLYKENKMSLAEAKKKYPEWYERVVLNKETKGHWTCKKDLYRWWIRKIKSDASFGHRYFSIMCLAIYGIKCGISKAEVEKDAKKLISHLNSLNIDKPFTEDDVKSAMECYDLRYVTFPIEDIIKISGIQFKKNKRNGRTQEQHIRVMNAIRDVEYPNGSWREGNGRKRQLDKVYEWMKDHPSRKKADCIRDTGLAKSTVYKWWDEALAMCKIDYMKVASEKFKEDYMNVVSVKLNKLYDKYVLYKDVREHLLRGYLQKSLSRELMNEKMENGQDGHHGQESRTLSDLDKKGET